MYHLKIYQTVLLASLALAAFMASGCYSSRKFQTRSEDNRSETFQASSLEHSSLSDSLHAWLKLSVDSIILTCSTSVDTISDTCLPQTFPLSSQDQKAGTSKPNPRQASSIRIAAYGVHLNNEVQEHTVTDSDSVGSSNSKLTHWSKQKEKVSFMDPSDLPKYVCVLIVMITAIIFAIKIFRK